MQPSAKKPEELALETRVRTLRAELARAEERLRAARGAPAAADASIGSDQGGWLLAWHESVERALEQALGRLRSHVESSPLAVVEWSADQRVVSWSLAAERLFGWSLDEVRGRRLGELGLLGPPDCEALHAPPGERRQERSRELRPIRNVCKDGRVVWCEWYTSVLRDRAGRISSVLSLVLDVTQRRRVEEELRASRSAAARRAAELETVFESLDFPLLVFDAEGKPVRTNRAARETVGLDPVGLSAEGFLGHVTGSLRLRSPSGRELERRELPTVRALAGEEVRGLVLQITDGAGRTRAMAVTGLPLRVEGRVSGAVVAWFDITERLEAEAARREEAEREGALRRAAECAVHAKDEFLAMLGHELRNPLAPILTAVQLLRLNGAGSIERAQAIIERQARHMMRLVDDLLDVSRITRGAVRLERRSVDLKEAVARAAEVVSPLLEERTHRLELEVPCGLVVVGDEDRLVQVFSNLLENAAKFTPSGGNIGVRASAAAGRIRLSFRDDGAGIAPELLPQIFELFVQGDRRLDRARGGLGLGLTLVRTLTEAHGGRVEAHSAGPGRGSEFVVELPLAHSAATAVPVQQPLEGPEAAKVRGRRVLVVDDNQDAADMLAEGLRLQGHEVRVAYDGPEALEVAAELDPEVALLDIGLPVMSGYELAQHLRARAGARCHLVAVTGYGQESDRARAHENGFAVHVVKPLDLEAVRELVRGAPGAGPAANPGEAPVDLTPAPR